MTVIATVLISLALPTLVYAVIAAPLSAVLARLCGDADGVRFWARFAALMLYLAPLFVALVFGLPESATAPPLVEVVPRALSSTLFGLVVALGGIGVRLSTLARTQPHSRPTEARRESWPEPRQ